ncbi:lysylphosphatidylglycerol synthase transmembrane domain-containing protein [Paraburkholderia guartelaensis]|uniref:lysylphosphatidylglycerol synthase transmembrane domain-containing protein n=1 Tax=Paraburkholderia guartelaensis TaxID=2546446 RepID=UPI002AB71926|nr:lysylphosphatidylglycerol synthase transmembrane domain-containing protein [Paraburkholderia guartelaensis]
MNAGPSPPECRPDGKPSAPRADAPNIVRTLSVPNARLRAQAAWAVGLLCLLVLVVAVVRAGSLERSLALARAARPGWLLIAVAAQISTYLSAALVWRQPLHDSGYELPMRVLVRLGIIKVFTDQALPSAGLGGSLMAIRGLLRRGVPRSIALTALLSSLLSRDIAFLIVVFMSAAILWLHHAAGTTLFAGVAVFLLVLLLVPAILMALRRWNQDPRVAMAAKWLHLSRLIESFRDVPLDVLLNRRLLARTVVLQLAIFLLDACTLWLALGAVGAPARFWVAFASFAVASMAATIGPVPVGLGTFEAASVGMLKVLGVPIEAALAATLLLRGFTFWLPMLPGFWLARVELRASRRKAEASHDSSQR